MLPLIRRGAGRLFGQEVVGRCHDPLPKGVQVDQDRSHHFVLANTEAIVGHGGKESSANVFADDHQAGRGVGERVTEIHAKSLNLRVNRIYNRIRDCDFWFPVSADVQVHSVFTDHFSVSFSPTGSILF
jgi:hypothetical protein